MQIKSINININALFLNPVREQIHQQSKQIPGNLQGGPVLNVNH